jgi:transposase-like protein
VKKISYKGNRLPSEIFQQVIWLYVRFTLSFRDVEVLLAERGYESIRRWVNHFGPKTQWTRVNAGPSPTRLGIWTKVRHEGAKEEL